MQKTALVLSGGGSRGAYEIGVWRALGELDERFSMVVGSSVGAINGAVIAQGSFEQAEELWRKLETSHVFDLPLDETLPPKKKLAEAVRLFGRAAFFEGGAGARALSRLLADYVDEEAVRGSPIDFGVSTVRLDGLKPHYIWKDEMPAGKLIDYLLASSALFPAVRPHEIDGARYIDGGYHDAMPIRMAIDRGAEKIIAVNIEALGIIRREREFRSYEIREIKSYWNLGSVLLFDPLSARQNMRLGYLDTMRSYGVYDGYAFAFVRGTLTSVVRQYYSGFYEQMDLLGFKNDRRRFPDSVAYRALEAHVFRRGVRPPAVRGFALDGMERAAELFELDANVLYGKDRFLERLREAAAKASPPEAAEQGNGPAALIGGLTDRRMRTVLIARAIAGTLARGQRGGLPPLAALMPEEFSAALFLVLAGILGE